MHPLPNFERYEVGVTPCSNYVYRIAVFADFESSTAASQEEEKLLAALQEKYGKATLTNPWTNTWSYTITQGTREVCLSRSRNTDATSLFLGYEDTALHSQAKWEQAAIDAADPERKAQRRKLEKQL